MKQFLTFLFSLLSPNSQSGSYIELDKALKAKLKIGGLITVFIFLILMTLTFVFYFQWAPINEALEVVKQEFIKNINEKSDFPAWVVKIVSFLLLFTLAISILFLYFLIDLGKVHYKLDSITFRVIKKINIAFHERTFELLGCPDKTNCNLREKLKIASNSRKFTYEFFYFYANQNTIGAYNQEDKRKEVFREWSNYYIFNFTLISILLNILWLSSIILIKASVPIIPIIIIIIVLTGIILFYLKIGKVYRNKLIAIGLDQLNIIFTEVDKDAQQRLKKLFGSCYDNNCKLN